MSYNNNFYNNFPGNGFTFQNNFTPSNFSVPPPPLPPSVFIPPWPPQVSDRELVKSFETRISVQNVKVSKQESNSIFAIREKIKTLVLSLENLKEKESTLKENINTLSEIEWNESIKQIEKMKAKFQKTLREIEDPYLDMARKLLAKRSAKRLRLKRVREEKKREKEERIKEMKENSRQIDENLQKIKDDIEKAKQDAKAKLHADVVLKEVLRKKHDAKKCIEKLDALLQLRKARQNTAKGRGDTVNESELEAFNSKMDNLKSLWSHKLKVYEQEENQLRANLKHNTEDNSGAINETERDILNNLSKWREVLFGGVLPQVDFHGDVARFVAVRSQWDQFVSTDGSSLPIGWVLPIQKS